MRSILLQLVALALAQASATTARTGDIARSLTAEDIATVERMVGTKPWLVEGRRPAGSPSKSQTIQAYFAPTTVTPNLRRGAYLTFTRELNPGPGPWEGVGSARPYFQVAVPGRPYEQIENDNDLNRPFTVKGNFQNDELIELVTFIRSNPEVPEGRGRGKVGTSPISFIERLPDGSARVEWQFEPNQGQRAILEKRGANWALISVNRFVVIVN
jgi:hypothetical protein